MKKIRICAALFLVILILSGCGHHDAPISPLRLVTQIDITCHYGTSLLTRHYTATDKMEQVLLYLRLLHRGLSANTNPEQIEGIHYKIVLHYFNGQQKIYHQRADKYFSENFKPWLNIDPEQGSQLLHLLLELPSDAV